MTETYLREFSGKIIAVLQTDTNGDQTLRDFPSRAILGYYRKNKDMTTTFMGVYVGKGNILTSLIKQR